MRLECCRLASAVVLAAAVMSGVAWAQEACKDPRRVVGGQPADIKDHAWQVALNVGGNLCGGSIIHPSWVLTAAHCFEASTKAGDVLVKAGATNRKIGGTWAPIEKIVVHKQYNGDIYWPQNDIALVKVKSRLPGSIIQLASPDLKLQHCQDLEVSGWGYTMEGGAPADNLQMAIIPLVDTAMCNGPQAYNGKILPHMMCAGFVKGKVDACKGDSGGPLVLRSIPPGNEVLVGVVSWGEGCAQENRYGVYTRVAHFRDWISQVIESDGKR